MIKTNLMKKIIVVILTLFIQSCYLSKKEIDICLNLCEKNNGLNSIKDGEICLCNNSGRFIIHEHINKK